MTSAFSYMLVGSRDQQSHSFKVEVVETQRGGGLKRSLSKKVIKEDFWNDGEDANNIRVKMATCI